jgi:putative transposase
VACLASSLSFPTTTRVSSGQSAKVLPGAVWQRCYVHFLRNALDYEPRKVDDDCLQELRWIYDRRDLPTGQARGLEGPRGAAQHCRLAGQVAGEASQAVQLGRGQHRRDVDLLSAPACLSQAYEATNMRERLNQEIKRRTHVVRIFPHLESCLRLVRALAVETHWN